MNPLREFSLAVAALLLVAGQGERTAHADTDPFYEVGAFAGAHFFNHSDALGRTEARPETILQHTGGFGLRVAVGPHPRLLFEGELLLTPTHTADGSANVLGVFYRAHAMVHILTGRVRPFVLLGGGGFSNTSDNSLVVRPDTIWAVHGGVGVKVDIGKTFGLRFDARAMLVPSLPGCYPVVAEEELLLGFYAHFDGGKKPPPAKSDAEAEPAKSDAEAAPNKSETETAPAKPDAEAAGGGK